MENMRTYDGEPLDQTVQHLSEVEVPGDNSAKGEVKTDFAAETSLQEKIHELNMLNPNSTLREIAAEVDCSHTYVKGVLDGDVGGQYSRYRKETWDEYTKTEKQIIKLYKSGVYETKKALANSLDVSTAYVVKVTKANSHLLDT